MKIATAQYPIGYFESWEDWKSKTETWIDDAGDAQILVFPEYGSMELVSIMHENIRIDLKKQLVEMNYLLSGFLDLYIELAQKYKKVIICPSFPVLENGIYLNRAYVVSPQGMAGYQDKFFMTRFENEDWGITTGDKELKVFETKWGSFGIQICYDVEFGIGSKLLCEAGAEVIFAPSCTETMKGAARVHVGARARSLENQCYVVVAQTVNNAEWSPAVDINYGYGAVYITPDIGFPDDGVIQTGKAQEERWLFETLDMSKIKEVRRNGSVLNFKNNSEIKSVINNENIVIHHIKI